MFWSKNKKNRFTPAYPSFAIEKWGSRGYTLHGHVFVMYIYDLVKDVVFSLAHLSQMLLKRAYTTSGFILACSGVRPSDVRKFKDVLVGQS